MSETVHLSLLHTSYFTVPLPSSITCTIWCSTKRLNTLNMLDLSIGASIVSNSGADTGRDAESIALATRIRLEVGFTPFISRIFFSFIGGTCCSYRVKNRAKVAILIGINATGLHRFIPTFTALFEKTIKNYIS